MATNRTKTIFLALGLCLASALNVFSGSADAPESKSDDSDIVILDRILKKPDRKRMPSRDRIMMYYNNGEICLQSETVEGEFSLQLIHAESGATESIPAIAIGETVAVTLEAGIYQVSAYSSTGAQYSGELEIQ